MSVQLVILGYLRESDFHGYELKKEIQRYMGYWTDIKFGSIYNALRRLVESEAVEVVGEERQSKRPDRTIYRITAKGQELYEHLLKDLLKNFQRQYYDLDIGLFFGRSLAAPELCRLLQTRRADTEALYQKLEAAKQIPAHRFIPKISEIIIDHGLYHLQAELDWLKHCQQRLEKENMYLSPAQAAAVQANSPSAPH